MRRKTWIVAVTATVAVMSGIAGCGSGEDAEMVRIADDIETRLAAYAETEIATNLEVLPASEREALGWLVKAAGVMHEAFVRQALPLEEEIRGALDAATGPRADAARAYFAINAGPWDRRFHHDPFFGDWEHPEGANFYPLDLTQAELASLESGEGGTSGLYSMIRRDDAGALKVVPYSEYFADEFDRAIGYMVKAADATANTSLRAFLLACGEAFRTDDYYASDLLWMDLDGLIEVVLGPIETYEDGLFGYKAAFEAFVCVADPEESGRLARFKGELPWLEANLPIPAADKNPNRGSDSPIRVVDVVYTAGDTRTGIQTIAFNLPNDEKVREAKGSKKVLLRNIMNAKFTQILTPIAEKLLVADQLGSLAAESFFMHTLWHEMSHGLGPGRIVKGGRDTDVRLELKDIYSAIEEAKADAMGPWCIFKLQQKGYFPASIYEQQAVTYL
ncbi:peptidase, partial [bacterium]|nr:peptidase [bacterium]